MSSDWQEFSLGDICTKITDGAHNSPKSVSIGMPMASVKDLTEFGVNLKTARHISIEDYEFLVKQGCRPEVGDVLIAKDGNTALDTACIVNQEIQAVMLSSVAILRPDKTKLDSNFLKFYFRSKRTLDYLKSNFISGAAIPRVVLKDFRKAKITLPPLPEQRRVVEVLQPIEDKIQLNLEINTKLEQLAKSIFKSWFVEFGPVHAKKYALEAGLTRAQAERASMAVISNICSPLEYAENTKEFEKKFEERLSSIGKEKAEELKATALLFPSDFEEGEFGAIPKGWSYYALENVVETIIDHRGKTPPKLGSNWINTSPYKAYSAKNIKGNRLVNLEDVKFVDFALYKKWMKDELKSGDILMTSEGPMGEFLFLQEDVKWVLSQRLYGIRANRNNCSSEFLYEWLQTNMAKHDLDSRSTGTTVTGIRQSELRKVNILNPTPELTKRYSATTASIYMMIWNNELQNQSLLNLRDSLLPKLLSREINLEELQIKNQAN